ncbi:SagB family peptide dehydrogenase [Paenibacillus thermotolerans]|uniref:SagB family peptide dehydrogenase n=1 Tax=Paenibacillus thermotolerans TaxID=3027807 RepID=UPI002367729C|nr:MULTISPECIES: SagB family peptide dehydrogenase [unclassified Paenibacillus]
MSTPETFLRHLHRNTHEIVPPDWEVDWNDAPLKYKLYRGLPTVPLSAEVPLTLEEKKPSAALPELDEIGHFLWYVYGLTQLCQLADSPFPSAGPMQMMRRFVPSGGGLYPNELYVYLKIKNVPRGIYHYDAAHHRLVLLREGDFDGFLSRALGDRCDVSACFGVTFISAMFWKNFFKYHNFSYRLQGLDTGVLIGQLLEVAKRFGYSAVVFYQFLDRAVNRLLGLSEREESAYSVIPLSVEPANMRFTDVHGGSGYSAAELCSELPAVRHDHYVRSRRVKEHPMLTKANEASMLESSGSFRRLEERKHGESGLQSFYLSRINRLSYDMATVCRKRFSPEMEFVLDKVTEPQLAVMLLEAVASFSYRNDLDGPNSRFSRISLYGCLYNVDGVPDGAYRYDGSAHALRRVFPGDHRLRLQEGMSLDNINMFQVPLCFHVVGDNNHLHSALGSRGYRIQQMEAGIYVQRLLLAASAVGMGGRPLLGFREDISDAIYKVNRQGKTSLIQIPIGPYRPRPSLEGAMHS